VTAGIAGLFRGSNFFSTAGVGVLGSYYSAIQDVVFLKDLKLQYIVVFTVLGMV
jgi:hypothetical protein